MKTILMSTAVIFTATTACWSKPPPDQLVRKLTEVIREHVPDATIRTNDVFTAKSGTMRFTVHGHLMTGEIAKETHQEEGPNFKGFVLTVAVNEGAYQGQAEVPQELHGPYFPTYINAVPTEDGKNHYWISFSFGSRLDPKLKQAVFAALPGGEHQGTETKNGSTKE